MYASEYARSRNYPYSLILQLCQSGKIPSIKIQKYVIDPVEADAVMEQLKHAPKYTPKQKQEIVKKEERKKAASMPKKTKVPYLELLKGAL